VANKGINNNTGSGVGYITVFAAIVLGVINYSGCFSIAFAPWL
jgi:hypothetical protein|tara:strand:- start:311 stop:439 length:129 start_codon:yes stop_codon:yes gene_type:complete